MRGSATVYPVGEGVELTAPTSNYIARVQGLLARKDAEVPNEETKEDDEAEQQIQGIQAWVLERWAVLTSLSLPSQEEIGIMIWEHQYFKYLVATLHILNVMYILSGIYLVFLYRKSRQDACEPEVFAYTWYDYRARQSIKMYDCINALKVLALIVCTKIMHYFLLLVLRFRPCPLRLKLNWSEATRASLLIELFNPLLFFGLLVWYAMTSASQECRGHYSAGMYLRMKRMVDAQFFYQLPFAIYLYVGALLCSCYRRVSEAFEWMLDGFPDAVKRETDYVVEDDEEVEEDDEEEGEP